MVQIQRCDHHGPEGTVPSTRSRARMLEQLKAAEAFGAAFLGLVRASTLDVKLDVKLVDDHEAWQQQPTLRWDTEPEAFFACWQAFMAWQRRRPTGDDWAPAVDPPSTTRVPPDDPETEKTL